MNGYVLPSELKMLQETVRRFMREQVLPLEATMDHEQAHLPEPELKKLQAKAKKAGLWWFATPEKHGGAGLDVFAQTLLAEETSQHRNGAYNAALGAFGKDPPVVVSSHGSPYQIERWLLPTKETGRHTFVGITEHGGGSDPARTIKTRARKSGDKYILNGSKIFISEVDQSDWGIVFARTSDDPGRKGISCFIVDRDTPGLSWRFVPVIRPWYPTELHFEDVEIPADQLLGEEGQGFTIVNEWLVHERMPYAAACIGIAAAALRIAVDHAKQRELFGSRLAEKQSIQWMIADSEVEIRAARWLTWEAAWKADRGEDAKYEASICKVYATEAANRVVDRCVQILGGYGISKEFPLERWYRELRIKRIGEGPSEVHRMVISREILR